MSILLNPDLERRIAGKVEGGLYRTSSEVVDNGLDLLDMAERRMSAQTAPEVTATKPIWEEVVAIGQSIPKEAWSQVPTDLSQQVDHYLHGSPKRPE